MFVKLVKVFRKWNKEAGGGFELFVLGDGTCGVREIKPMVTPALLTADIPRKTIHRMEYAMNTVKQFRRDHPILAGKITR